MSDVDLSEFHENQNPNGPSCRASTVLDQMDEEQQAKYLAAMSTRSIHATTVAKVLKGWGIIITSECLQRHRRGVCACP